MTLPVLDPLDSRLNAFSDTLTDSRLKEKVKSANYIDGMPAQISMPCVDVRKLPDLKTGIDTQFLLGQNVLVFDRKDGWAWVQSEFDDYVGWVEETCLSAEFPEFTHRVQAQRSYVYPAADLRFPVTKTLPMGSLVSVQGQAMINTATALITA